MLGLDRQFKALEQRFQRWLSLSAETDEVQMNLTTGTRIAHYEIISPLGTGGMGEVYRARDTKLSRDVAIKVLPEAFAHDAERMARFSREAQVLASLNHPNIAAIYGLEESDGVRALVMELVEGPTLADRITQGSLPLDEALAIARQIAEALEVAHERGIIHRDLKPANVKVTPDGAVKVLDFGLAKVFEEESSNTDLSHSPTLIKGTQAGVILGTAAYMIWILPLVGDRKPFPFLQTRLNESAAVFSPDGLRIACNSDESGREQLYVTPFPGPGRQWQVSTTGGHWPRWRRDGKEIYYFADDNRMMATEVNSSGDTFEVGATKPLFETRAVRPGKSYDVTADGQRFLVNTAFEEKDLSPLALVINWTAELKKK